MIEREVLIFEGLEAREAAFFVQTANKYKSKVQIKLDDKTVNAKSIMGVISVGIVDGDLVTIVAEGEDEQLAVSELCDTLVKSRE